MDMKKEGISGTNLEDFWLPGGGIWNKIEKSMSEQYQKKFLFRYSRNPRSASRLNVNLSCLQRERYMHVYI